MTANAMQGDRELCFAAGMDDYVSKPIRVEALVGALDKVQGHEVAGETEASETYGVEEHKHMSTESAPVEGQTSTGDGAVIDMGAIENLQEIIGSDPALLVEMIDSYLETTPPLLAKLNQGLSDGDAAAFRLAAHTLKSSSADFGATTLSKLSAQLEKIGKAGTLDGAAPLVAQAQTIYQQVEVALTDLRDQQV